MYGRSRCLSLHSSPRSLDNLINLVSLSLPTFFARHQVSSVSRQSLLSLSLSLPSLCFARLFTPSLPPSLPPSSLSICFLFARQLLPRPLLSPPLICTTDHGINGSIPSPEERDRYRVSVRGRRRAWRDGRARITIQAGVTIPNSFDIGRVRLPRNDERVERW